MRVKGNINKLALSKIKEYQNTLKEDKFEVRCTSPAIGDPWSDIEARFCPHDVLTQINSTGNLIVFASSESELRSKLRGSEYEVVRSISKLDYQ